MSSNKCKISEELFSNGEYNYELFKYAIEHVLETEKNQKETENKTKNEIKLKQQINDEKIKQQAKERMEDNIECETSLFCSFIIMLFSMMLIGLHYCLYARNPNYFNWNKL